MEKLLVKEEMDLEWKELILTALDMGISTEDIRHFLQNATTEN
ncbi:DNA-binding anti-repressor SinI [Bacillus mangrovi]|uniref:DNA-binding anti-repressor SinI n=1 Tax=Metabacillus mangrovi TaxID=1491830 RepID=A0A7X2S2A0_9BACI|nr:anti-repressor SinI family protein [Metabacillus mangrovi]MTH52383.1 DNA-binding anti-repressor SinI [Metabacillus mangrovi]